MSFRACLFVLMLDILSLVASGIYEVNSRADGDREGYHGEGGRGEGRERKRGRRKKGKEERCRVA